MCPFCFATLALVAAGATSAGGLAALTVKFSRRRSKSREINLNANERRKEDVYECDTNPESGVAR